MTTNPARPTMRQLAEERGALLRGEANLAQVRKVLRSFSDLQKAVLAAELLAAAVEQFPGAFDSLARAEVAHVRHILAHLSPADARDPR